MWTVAARRLACAPGQRVRARAAGTRTASVTKPDTGGTPGATAFLDSVRAHSAHGAGALKSFLARSELKILDGDIF